MGTTVWRRRGSSSFSDSFFFKISLESWRRGSHLQGGVGGRDRIGRYWGKRKFPGKTRGTDISTNHIPLIISLRFIGEAVNVSQVKLSHGNCGRNIFPWFMLTVSSTPQGSPCHLGNPLTWEWYYPNCGGGRFVTWPGSHDIGRDWQEYLNENDNSNNRSKVSHFGSHSLIFCFLLCCHQVKVGVKCFAFQIPGR